MRTVSDWINLYNSDDFNTKYYYDGTDLGACCIIGQTVIKLWSPLADEVSVNFYKDGEPTTRLYWTSSMRRAASGVWEWNLPENMHGTYYDFTITIDGVRQKTIDPYAKAAGVNGRRGMIIDLAQTNPADWGLDQPPQLKPETIISEIHVKEFSWEAGSGWLDEVRGKYKALTTPNTALDSDGQTKTGLDFLQQVGITHLQLMPIYDYGSVDESVDDDQFNWGYDPVNYNVPEGSYASDPHRAEVRISELKEAIQAIHSKGLGVIMDVVYNHTWNLEHSFQKTAPYYFYRTWQDGTLSNGSGCGDDGASERPMVKKYIIDSVMYWAKEYHLDGFRFDLMGLMTVELMNEIRAKLDQKYGKGKKLIYGEPWAADRTASPENVALADKSNAGLLDVNIGLFCDDTRDAIKGSAGNITETGFVNGGDGLEWKIQNSVRAWCNGQTNIQAPSQIINYTSAHDNQTLWDKLTATTADEDIRRRQYRLAVAIYMTCQGRIFMLSGSSFLRTKNGNTNSHDAPIEINRLDWSEIPKEQATVNYYRGLIALRQQLPGLCDKSPLAESRIGNSWSQPGLVGYMLDNTDAQSKSPWEYLCIVYNRNNEAKDIELDDGQWEILANGDDTWLWQHPESISGNATVDPISWIMLGQRYDRTTTTN